MSKVAKFPPEGGCGCPSCKEYWRRMREGSSWLQFVTDHGWDGEVVRNLAWLMMPARSVK